MHQITWRDCIADVLMVFDLLGSFGQCEGQTQMYIHISFWRTCLEAPRSGGREQRLEEWLAA